MISAVVLTHNDASRIQQTLASLAWADERIVIDDHSEDKTVAVAKKQGATVYLHALGGDFASQRNFGLSQATGDWVIFIDSDEVISPALARQIQTRITSTTASGFTLRRHDVLWGKTLRHGEIGDVRLLRVAKKTAGKWVRPVHEVWQIDGAVEELSEPLLHYPHPNVAQFIADVDRYSTVNANYLYTTGARASAWHIVAYPTAKFFVNYVWRMGFLDGMPGAVVAVMMSFHSFLSRAKVYLLRS